jgi:hypothetical protein
MLKDLLRPIVKKIAPRAISVYHAARMRQHFKSEFAARQSKFRTKIYGSAAPKVLSGPFVGMTYIDEIVWGPIESKWAGTYELELAEVISTIIKLDQYRTIIDVGSAEGYYAVGLARALPRAKVLSYDIDPWARSQQSRLAKVNGVSNLAIFKECSPAELERSIDGKTLLICDVEGYEYALVDPQSVPSLRNCDILIEVHDDASSGFKIEPGATELARRLGKTHAITEFSASPRAANQAPAAAQDVLDSEDLFALLDERRSPRQKWLWCQAMT